MCHNIDIAESRHTENRDSELLYDEVNSGSCWLHGRWDYADVLQAVTCNCTWNYSPVLSGMRSVLTTHKCP